MTDGMYIPSYPTEAVGRYENALTLITNTNPVYKKLYKAMKKRELPKDSFLNLLKPALEKNIITKAEAEMVEKAEAARTDAIQVDEFTLEEYMNVTPKSPDGEGLKTKEVDSLV
jgi:acyl-CoA dehydrogenase